MGYCLQIDKMDKDREITNITYWCTKWRKRWAAKQSHSIASTAVAGLHLTATVLTGILTVSAEPPSPPVSDCIICRKIMVLFVELLQCLFKKTKKAKRG